MNEAPDASLPIAGGHDEGRVGRTDSEAASALFSKTEIPDHRAAELHSALNSALGRLSTELQRSAGPKGFSREAIRDLLSFQAEYLEDLGVQAIKRARRDDVVSAAHVNDAERELRASYATKTVKAIEVIGGILTGAGISQLYTVLATKGSPPLISYVLATLSLVVGGAMLTYGLARN